MQVRDTDLPGVLIIEPAVHRDGRGFFLEVYHAEKFRAAGITMPFVQDNHSSSGARTLRGLHGQRERLQGKLVRCTRGAIFDVAVDARRGSPHFGRWTGVTLTAENFWQVWVPPGFLHGFCVLGDGAEVEYKCTDLYAPALELSVRWDDPDIGVAWPIGDPVLSPKDAAAARLRDVTESLAFFPND